MTRRPALLMLAALTALATLATVPPARADDSASCDETGPRYLPQTPDIIASLAVERAWTLSEGESVLVAVVDSGVDGANPHLQGTMVPGIDLVDPHGDGKTDAYGHGTAVAGLIAARKVDGSGLVGIAPRAKILPVRVYTVSPDDREGPKIDPDKLAEGIRRAAERRARIIVVAASAPGDSQNGQLDNAVTEATRRGSLVVAAAGNVGDPGVPSDHEQSRFPASASDALSVTAVDQLGHPSDDVVRSALIDIAAPGKAVLTTLPNGHDCVLSPDKASSSYATAYVAGAAALVASAFPNETPAQWADRLRTTASRPRPIQDPEEVKRVGWGIVAPYAALNIEDVGAAPGPRSDPPSRQVPPPLRLSPPPATPHALLGTIGPIAGVTVVALIVVSLLKVRRRTERKNPTP